MRIYEIRKKPVKTGLKPAAGIFPRGRAFSARLTASGALLFLKTAIKPEILRNGKLLRCPPAGRQRAMKSPIIQI